MTPVENPLYRKGHCLCGHSESCPNCSAYVDPAWADAQALADVRTLDEWAKEDNGRVWSICQHDGPLPSWCCKLGGLRWWNQDTPELARAVAAAWVRGLK